MLRQIGGDAVNKVQRLALQDRYRGFRPDHQIGWRLGVGQVTVQFQCVGNVGRVPLVGLLYVGLHQIDAQALADWPGPVDVLQQQAAAPEQAYQRSNGRRLQWAAQQTPLGQQACDQH